MFFKEFGYFFKTIFLGLRLRKKSSFALRIFKIKIHFYPLDFRLGGDGNCYTVIPPIAYMAGTARFELAMAESKSDVLPVTLRPNVISGRNI